LTKLQARVEYGQAARKQKTRIREVESMSDVFDRTKGIIVDLLGVDPDKVTPEARFREDLEADSLDLVELIMAVEEEFGGTISDEEAQQLKTVGDAVKYVEDKMS
jgi:acyl carrier protein